MMQKMDLRGDHECHMIPYIDAMLNGVGTHLTMGSYVSGGRCAYL